MDATQLLTGQRIVPVVIIEQVSHAVPTARALLDGGLTAIEVTLRSDAALAAIGEIASKVPDMLVGAGSVRTAQALIDVQAAGARFAVSPGHSDSLLSAAAQHQLPLVPGAATPAEAMALFEQGYALQKLFPAEIVGGTDWLRAIAGPLPEIRFFPTGGIRLPQVESYLSLGNVACIGGTWLAPATVGATPDVAGITARAREALAACPDAAA